MQSDPDKKRYNIAATVRKAVAAQQMLGHGELRCSATLSRGGRKLNSIDRAPQENFTRLMHQYIQAEQPDKLRIELRKKDDALLWSKTFDLPVAAPPPAAGAAHQGLGEAEINDLVTQRLETLRRDEELHALRAESEALQQENRRLKGEMDALEEAVEAKKKVEYYANILGLAFPGLAKMLSATPLGGTLGLLAGMDVPTAEDNPQDPTGQRQAIIDLVTEFLTSLDDAQLGQLYLVFVELSNRPDRIPALLSAISEPPKTPAS